MWKDLASNARLPFHEGPSKSKIDYDQLKFYTIKNGNKKPNSRNQTVPVCWLEERSMPLHEDDFQPVSRFERKTAPFEYHSIDRIL